MPKLALSCILVLLLSGVNSKADDEEAHLLALIIKDASGFRIVETTLVNSRLPRQFDRSRIFPWRLNVVGKEGRILYQAGLADPTVIRGEFRNPNEPGKIDAFQIRRNCPVHFSVRLPMVDAARVDILAYESGVAGKDNHTRLGSFAYPQARHPRFRIYDVEVIQETGDPANRVDIVILGDGYRLEDQEKLTNDILAFVGSFFSFTSIGKYHNFFNIKLIHVISRDNGADNGSYGADRDTALGAYYGCYGIDRLICVDDAAVYDVANTHAPEYDNLIVIVNDPKYGGAGGFIAVFAANEYAGEVSVHEYGHSMGGLADEYDDPSPGFPECTDDCPEPNVTTRTNREEVKWNLWILPETPVPTPETAIYQDAVGVFEGARYQITGVYRPKQECIMRYFGYGFCEVCAEAMVLSFYNVVSLLDDASPASPIQLSGCDEVVLSVTYPTPDPDSMIFTWKQDGQVLDTTSGGSYLLSALQLGDGTYQLSVEIADATTLVRNDPTGLLTAEHDWTVTVTGTGNGACVFDGECYLDGELNPVNACQICLIASNPSGWSNDDSKPCDDLDSCTAQDQCAGGVCTGQLIENCCRDVQECDDGLDCTQDECDPDNHVCNNNIRTTYCAISGSCYQNGEANPEDSCQICNSAESQTDWTKIDNCPESCACSGGHPPSVFLMLLAALVLLLRRRQPRSL
jgi:MYXO-CTERM domain-containing protein